MSMIDYGFEQEKLMDGKYLQRETKYNINIISVQPNVKGTSQNVIKHQLQKYYCNILMTLPKGFIIAQVWH